MIRVTIEMVPAGIESAKYLMHVIEIGNDVVGTFLSGGKKGDYWYRISRKFPRGKKIDHTVWQRSGVLLGFNRSAKNSVRLLQDVLNNEY